MSHKLEVWGHTYLYQCATCQIKYNRFVDLHSSIDKCPFCGSKNIVSKILTRQNIETFDFITKDCLKLWLKANNNLKIKEIIKDIPDINWFDMDFSWIK